MIDYLAHIVDDSLRFGEALRSGDLGARVPTCPDWTLADLGFHLAEVQYFWGSIVAGLLVDPGDIEPLPRPDDDADIPALFDRQSLRMVTAMRRREPDAACWTWHHEAGTVAWVLRRQAHEALIHRVDAEIVSGGVAPLDRELAVDGVDELLKVMVGGFPDWASFTEDGTSIAIRLTDSDQSWQLLGGRMTGTSPNTGNEYDLDAVVVRDGAAAADTTIEASAAAMDLWLWGRGDDIVVTGDAANAHRLRSMAAEDTQ